MVSTEAIGWMDDIKPESIVALGVIAETTAKFTFPNVTAPDKDPKTPPNRPLLNFGMLVYCYPWIRHFSSLSNGVLMLVRAENIASGRIVARSLFELCAHVYYVQKHLKQHIAAKNYAAAWKFLTPIAIGSRYMNERDPSRSPSVPAPPHISKAVKCFEERIPKESREDYSYLSEYSHPNTMAFQQHYKWLTPRTVTITDQIPIHGFLGSTTGACIQALLAADNLLELAEEREVRLQLRNLLEAIANLAKMAD